jgi:hypothetical protein
MHHSLSAAIGATSIERPAVCAETHKAEGSVAIKTESGPGLGKLQIVDTAYVERSGWEIPVSLRMCVFAQTPSLISVTHNTDAPNNHP